MQLTPSAFEAAKAFIERHGRSLEAARLRVLFGEGTVEAALHELKAFQNADGGFGHGLEPDVQTPDSSVICTTVALQIMRSLGVGVDHPLYAASIDFLLSAYHPPTGHWPNIPPSAEQSPHAPWWSQTNGSEGFQEFSLNPTAEVLGYLYEAGDRVPHDLRAAVTAKVQAEILALDRIEMHDLLCCVRLLQTPTLPTAIYAPLLAQVSALVSSAVDVNPSDWEGYGLRPLQIVDRPSSPFLAGLESAVEDNLDYEITTQSESGAWEPLWSWEDDFPAAWPAAKMAWCGVLTLEKLGTLKRFGRIATSAISTVDPD